MKKKRKTTATDLVAQQDLLLLRLISVGGQTSDMLLKNTGLSKTSFFGGLRRLKSSGVVVMDIYDASWSLTPEGLRYLAHEDNHQDAPTPQKERVTNEALHVSTGGIAGSNAETAPTAGTQTPVPPTVTVEERWLKDLLKSLRSAATEAFWMGNEDLAKRLRTMAMELQSRHPELDPTPLSHWSLAMVGAPLLWWAIQRSGQKKET